MPIRKHPRAQGGAFRHIALQRRATRQACAEQEDRDATPSDPFREADVALFASRGARSAEGGMGLDNETESKD